LRFDRRLAVNQLACFGFADERPANPVARIFKETANDSPACRAAALRRRMEDRVESGVKTNFGRRYGGDQGEGGSAAPAKMGGRDMGRTEAKRCKGFLSTKIKRFVWQRIS
jgi:hypothetical protein